MKAYGWQVPTSLVILEIIERVGKSLLIFICIEEQHGASLMRNSNSAIPLLIILKQWVPSRDLLLCIRLHVGKQAYAV